jgi:hypothetical protein
VRGSIASHSHSTCVALRSLVRSSSHWRWGSGGCGSCARARTERASPRETTREGWWPDGSRRHVRRRKHPALRRARDPHHSDVVRGGFQTIQGGVASGSESRVAGRASKRLDPLGMAMLTIPDQCVDVSICDPAVRALLVGTGKTLRVHPLGALPGGFSPHARGVQALEQVSQPTRGCRRGDRQGNRAGCVA